MVICNLRLVGLYHFLRQRDGIRSLLCHNASWLKLHPTEVWAPSHSGLVLVRVAASALSTSWGPSRTLVRSACKGDAQSPPRARTCFWSWGVVSSRSRPYTRGQLTANMLPPTSSLCTYMCAAENFPRGRGRQPSAWEFPRIAIPFIPATAPSSRLLQGHNHHPPPTLTFFPHRTMCERCTEVQWAQNQS